MGQGSSSPKDENIEVNGNEATFFAKRDAPVQFSDDLISHLSVSSLPSSSSPNQARQETLDSHIQARISAELSRLHEQEASVREEIERALEKENLDKEASGGSEGEGVSHSATLLKDLEELEKRTVGLREESQKNKSSDAWVSVESTKSALVECFLGNKETPLNCREAAESFVASVAGVENTFVSSI